MPVLAQSVQGSYGYGDVAIIGDDSVAIAFGVTLSLGGHNVRLWLPQGNSLSEFELHGIPSGVVGARAAMRFSAVTKDIAQAVSGAGVIVIGSPASSYSYYVDLLLPYLSTGQTIVLVSAPLGASLQFAKGLKSARAALEINLLETNSLFDAVGVHDRLLSIYGLRPCVSICGVTRNATYRGLSVLGHMRNGLMPASNVLERGFADVEQMLRPIFRLFQVIYTASNDLPAMPCLLTPGLLAIIGGIAGELQSVARAFGVTVRPIGQIVAEYIGYRDDSLAESLAKWCNACFFKIQAPQKDACIYWKKQLMLDIEETLVPLVGFAMVARQPVPLIDSIIELAEVVCGEDLRRKGRSLADLDLVGLDVQEITEMVNA